MLTGTPLENRLEELISIVQFVDRFRLGPTFRLLHEHQVRDEHGKVVGYSELDRIGQTLEPILLRRHKRRSARTTAGADRQQHLRADDRSHSATHHSENMEIVARIVQKWRRYRFLSEADQRRLMIALQRMRMSCDSTYLVDHRTDHGKKADEVVTLLDEMFERTPTSRRWSSASGCACTSCWCARLKDRDWDHVLFHGGVPAAEAQGPDRPLPRRARTAALFLSTDAGGVGLNLQHASVVVNMDLPWNPAVLEQRIGRVHRLGQKQPVRVVNFVAQGTIEEGMLGVLKFKKSLFAGVLDDGDKEVFLGGSRLNKFMETVETATTAIPQAMAEDAEEAPVERADEETGAAGHGAAVRLSPRRRPWPPSPSRTRKRRRRPPPPTPGQGWCRRGWRCCSSSWPRPRRRAHRRHLRRRVCRRCIATNGPGRVSSSFPCPRPRCSTRP